MTIIESDLLELCIVSIVLCLAHIFPVIISLSEYISLTFFFQITCNSIMYIHVCITIVL